MLGSSMCVATSDVDDRCLYLRTKPVDAFNVTVRIRIVV